MRKLLSIAVVVCALAASGPAWTQTPAEFTDQQLESFVVAAIAVDELIREWNPRIRGAENAEQAAQLREEANAELVETITRTEGITFEEYQQVGRTARDDPALAARIDDIYEARTGD